ncbi:hypothetical protein DENSPDRAFT_430528 [Dentipellis sp. KUC8613]|nr:hypothetical protein DENSPDRAFT_430528 [Dentipellis sp. KUC8613]
MDSIDSRRTVRVVQGRISKAEQRPASQARSTGTPFDSVFAASRARAPLMKRRGRRVRPPMQSMTCFLLWSTQTVVQLRGGLVPRRQKSATSCKICHGLAAFYWSSEA